MSVIFIPRLKPTGGIKNQIFPVIVLSMKKINIIHLIQIQLLLVAGSVLLHFSDSQSTGVLLHNATAEHLYEGHHVLSDHYRWLLPGSGSGGGGR